MEFKIVHLKAPYENWDLPRCREVFSWVVELNREGYGSRYSKKVLPLDSSSFIGEHVVVLTRTGQQGWFPAMCFRFTSASQFKAYQLGFPLETIARDAKAVLHQRSVSELLENSESRGKEVFYFGGWTISEQARSSAETLSELKECLVALHVLAAESSVASFVLTAAAVDRVRSTELISRYGYQTIQTANSALPPVLSQYLGGEPVSFMQLTEVPFITRLMMRKWRETWDQRELVKEMLHDQIERKSA